jgi:hypothetical protein
VTSPQALASAEEATRPLRAVPSIGPQGRLTYRHRTICLSERNAMLASVFVYHFEEDLTDLELLDRIWPDGATRFTVRMCLRQLDRRLARVGLTIVQVAGHAHALRALEAR